VTSSLGLFAWAFGEAVFSWNKNTKQNSKSALQGGAGAELGDQGEHGRCSLAISGHAR
jgi:hypothetical protein